MRRANNKTQFTPFGLWLQEYIRDDLSITNLDYVIEDYRQKRIMLLEEKQCLGVAHTAQVLTFEVVDWSLHVASMRRGYDYWGFYVLRFPKDATMPGPGMTLNGTPISTEELQRHLDFRQRFCEPYQFGWRLKAMNKAVRA